MVDQFSKILIVDDEPELCEILAFELEDEGYQTAKAFSGLEAYGVLTSEKIDCVITDVRMPNESGLDLLVKVRDFFPDLPVIFVTGFSDISAEEAKKLGAQEVFTKPINYPALLKTVADVLKSKRKTTTTF